VSDEAQRQFAVQRIYTKDISFESPNSPAVFQEQKQPEIKVGLGSQISKLSDTVYELVLKVSVDAKHDDKSVFMVEVQQGGIFVVQGFEQQEVDALLGIAAPNVLFPYAREVVSDMIMRGSFPQFVLQPVNFEALYAQQLQAKNQQSAGNEGETVQ
jgi:preprotein translocase subunit SecB